jgi:hypothetical protein
MGNHAGTGCGRMDCGEIDPGILNQTKLFSVRESEIQC